MTRFVLLFAILWLCSTVCNAQITTGEHPFSWDIELKTRTSVPVVDLDLPDISTILSEDEDSQRQGNPFIRTAVPVPVCINMSTHGEWSELLTGDRIWRVQIDAIDALSLDLSFDQLWLPQGGKLFVYNPSTHEVIGAITSEYLQGSMSRPADFSTGVIRGNQLVVEYYQPRWLKINPVLSISNVYYGYRDLPYMRTMRGYGDSGSCQVNVNCAEGANWKKEKRAVARIYVKYSGGGTWCTGALVNNTSGDMSALLLTADHCLNNVFDAVGNSNLSQSIFYWDYECPGCTCNASPTVKSTVGATLLANNKNSDFALLRLTQDPRNLDGFTPYYLGWDRTEKPSSSGVGIHHPRGDVKKIATYDIIPAISNCFDQIEYDRIGHTGYRYNNENFWRIIWNRTANGHSVTEGGSSGSPLISSNRKIIGQLYGSGFCPNPNCSNPSADIANYGKFSVSWTGGGTADNRRKLQPWLDPQGINPQTFDGMEALPPTSLTGPTQICNSSGTFTLNNLPTGATVQWSTGGRWNALQLSHGQGTAQATYGVTGSGKYTVSATVNYLGASTTLSHTVQVGTLAPIIYGPFQNGHVMAGICACQSAYYEAATAPGITRYYWEMVDDSPYISLLGNKSRSFPLSVNRDASFAYIRCKQYQEGCGWSEITEEPIYFHDNCCRQWGIGPNPTPGPIELRSYRASDGEASLMRTATPSTTTLRHVQVFSSDGRLVLEQRYPTGTPNAQLDLSPLRPGTYHLLINGTEHHVVVRE